MSVSFFLVSVALAAPKPAPAPPAPTQAELDRDAALAGLQALEQAHAELVAAHDAAVQDVAAAQAQIEALTLLLERARVLLDDRSAVADRVRAAEELAASGDPRALPFLRVTAALPAPAVQAAAAEAGLTFSGAEAVSPAVVLLAQRDAPKELRLDMVHHLGLAGTPDAAQALWDTGGNERIQARIRAAAYDELRFSYPDRFASFGTPPPIADAFGALTFVTASGLAGGILLSSFGVWGQFEAGPALGAVGGSAIGLGAGGLYAATHPVTAGDGLAMASGVSFGLTYGLWTTTAVHGAWRYLQWPERDEAVEPAAAWRALGVVGGGALGLFSVSRNPTAWDVLEVDAAGYLGSGIALGAAGLILYHPPDPSSSTFFSSSFGTFTGSGVPRGGFERPRHDYDVKASQQLAVAEMIGATAGLATGYALHRSWRLDWRDGAISGVLAGEGAWAGGWIPSLVPDHDPELKGYVRLPVHAFAAGGLVLGELTDPSYGRTLSTAFGAGIGNALGASIPIAAGYDDQRSVATWMVPMGLAGTAAGFVVEPMIAPTPGDAAMIGVTTAVTGTTALWVGQALGEVWIDPGQAGGVALLGTGLGGLGGYGLAAAVDPHLDDMLVLGSAAAWGAGYGVLVPLAISDTGDPAVVYASTAATELAFTGAGALALKAGLRPRSTVVPQLLGLSGGTLGSLVAGLVQDEAQPVALGAVTGGTFGLGLGVLIEAVTEPRPRAGASRVALRHAPLVLPTFRQELGASGRPISMVGLDIVDW